MENEDFYKLEKLSAETKVEGAALTANRARILVDLFYQAQEFRKQSSNQHFAKSAGVDTGDDWIAKWLKKQTQGIEGSIQKLLQAYAENHPVGVWLLSICGIGPVIAAGLLA